MLSQGRQVGVHRQVCCGCATFEVRHADPNCGGGTGTGQGHKPGRGDGGGGGGVKFAAWSRRSEPPTITQNPKLILLPNVLRRPHPCVALTLKAQDPEH